MTAADLPVLYSFRRCPFAMRARMAIAVSGRRCRLREVVLRDKPPALLAASPKATVPVLVLPDGGVIEESLDIMFWALRGADPQRWLEPEIGSLSDMTDLVAAVDGRFKEHLDGYKYPGRGQGADPAWHRDKATGFLERMADCLEGRGFLFGPAPHLADFAIFPFVRQFAGVEPDWFAAALPPALVGWLDGLCRSEIFASVMRKYPPWRAEQEEPIFPYKE